MNINNKWRVVLKSPPVSDNTSSALGALKHILPCRDGAIQYVFILSYKGGNPIIRFMGKVSRRNACWWTMACGSSSIKAKHGWAMWLWESQHAVILEYDGRCHSWRQTKRCDAMEIMIWLTAKPRYLLLLHCGKEKSNTVTALVLVQLQMAINDTRL